jgi:hypothetical protein
MDETCREPEPAWGEGRIRSKAYTISNVTADHAVAVTFAYLIALTISTFTIPISTTTLAISGATVSPLPDGDLNNDGAVTIADALRALQIAVGLITPTATDLAKGDVAPFVSNKPRLFFPLFIDAEELSIFTSLSDTIEEALRQSLSS